MKAICQCGALTAATDDLPALVVACHCTRCQRRTGSAFGLLVYVRSEGVELNGAARTYTREADSGGRVETTFCPDCGSSIAFKTSKHPTLLGLPVGAIGDADIPPPVRSVWETGRHPWVTMPAETQRFLRGTG